MGSKVSLIDLSSQKQLLDQFLVFAAEARQQGAEYPPADSFWSPDICGWKLRLCTRAELVLNSVDPEDFPPRRTADVFLGQEGKASEATPLMLLQFSEYYRNRESFCG